MKKNISINISGIIFHVEEDAFEKLSRYLDSVNRYFSNYDENDEIVSDIENRMAEIFLGKLDNTKQVIDLDDVDKLIVTMGSVKDFEAMDAVDEPVKAAAVMAAPSKKRRQQSAAESEAVGGRIYRDLNKRILGGVASGIAHRLKIAPVWVRLLWILLSLGFFVEILILPIVTIFTYVVLWIVLPPSEVLEDDQKTRKFFRDPDDRVIGGVSSGLSAYFGIETTVIRLLFFLSIFVAGSGLILYVILWIITPYAGSITEKMEMQGEPVTLSNIESSIKRSLDEDGAKEESALLKLLLFPFRLISRILRGLGKVVKPLLGFLVEAGRIFAGILLIILGISGLIAIISLAGAGFGLYDANMVMDGVPFNAITEEVSPLAVLFGLFASAIPLFLTAFIGFALIVKRWVINQKIGWTLFALWVLSLIGLSVFSINVAKNFKAQSTIRTEEIINIEAEEIHLDVKSTESIHQSDVALRLRGHDKGSLTLLKEIDSRGSSDVEAERNASSVNYNIEVNGSNLTFDSGVRLKEGAKYRGQNLEMTLYFPYGQVFTMDQDIEKIIRNTIYRNDYRTSDIGGNTWMFTEDGLLCVSCKRSFEENEFEDWRFDESSRVFALNEEFSSIEIGQGINCILIQDLESDSSTISFNGHRRDRYSDYFRVSTNNGKLKVSKRGSNRRNEVIKLTASDLGSIELNDGARLTFDNLSAGEMDLELSDGASISGDGAFDNCEIRATGGSKVLLTGSCEQLKVIIKNGSYLDLSEFEVGAAKATASSGSTLQLFTKESIDAKASGGSTIQYDGSPKERTLDNDKSSSIKSEEW